MKKLIHILILTFIISSCENHKNNLSQHQFYSNDFKDLEMENDFELINLDSIENFEQLRAVMGKMSCENRITGLKFDFEENEYYLTAFATCPTFGGVACYFRINDITIKNDSISSVLFDDVKLPIEDLGVVLDQIISNQYNYQFGKNKMKNALIHLYVNNDNSMETTKKNLKIIVEQFEKVNSSKNSEFFKYYILMEGYDRSNIPPPPPPPPNHIKEE